MAIWQISNGRNIKRKNRPYKRGEPYRDATLFVIACEGAVRERAYLEHLGEYSTRVRIKVLTQDGQHKSAPKWILDSAAQYVSEAGLKENDQLWIVMDVDRWKAEALHQIQQACEANAGWNLALSNPCFEVWLFLHLDDIINAQSTDCQGLKNELASKIQGGYNKVTFVKLIRDAHNRSTALDNDANHFIPETMRTKMHLLTNELLRLIGSNAGL